MMAAEAMRRPLLEALAEELGHGRGLESLRDLTRARTEHPPGKQAADDGVANARPGCGHAVLPAKLASVADEHDGAEVGGAVGEGRKPGTDVTTTENETVDIARGRTARVDADADRDGYEYDDE